VPQEIELDELQIALGVVIAAVVFLIEGRLFFAIVACFLHFDDAQFGQEVDIWLDDAFFDEFLDCLLDFGQLDLA
jgi:hypothetical protein